MPSPEDPHTSASHEAESSQDPSAESSKQESREGSRPPKKRHNVRFTSAGESVDTSNKRVPFDLRDDTNSPPRPRPLFSTISYPLKESISPSATHAASPKESLDIAESSARAPISKPRPSIMRLPSNDSHFGDSEDKSEDDESNENEDEEDDDDDVRAVGKAISQHSAQVRAERLSRMMGSHSAPGSRSVSPQRLQRTLARSPPPSPPPEGDMPIVLDLSHIPLERLKRRRSKYGIEDDTDDENENADESSSSQRRKKRSGRFYARAAQSVAHYKQSWMTGIFSSRTQTSPETASGAQTPVYERDPDHYVPRPKEYREGYLSSLLKLYNEEGIGSALSHIPSGHDAVARAAHRRDSLAPSLVESIASGATSPAGSPTPSGATTPKAKHQKWYYKNPQNQSTGALSDLVSSSTVFAHPTTGQTEASKAIRPKLKHRRLSAQALDTVMGKKLKSHKKDDSIRIQIHIAETMKRQDYLIKICRALMMYGAPTHRLEGT